MLQRFFSLPDDRLLDPRAADSLLREQYRVLCRQVPTLYVLLLINTLFLGVAMLGSIDWRVALGAPALVIAVMLSRLDTWLHRSATRHQIDLADIAIKLRSAAILSPIIAIGLDGWAITLIAVAPHDVQLFVPLFAAISTICSAYCMLSLPRCAIALIALGTVPVGVALALSGGVVMTAAALNLILVGCLMMRMVVNQYGQLRRIVLSHVAVAEERAKVHRLAHCDDLTGLPNRRAFLEVLEQSQPGHCDPDSSGVAVLMLDLDGFKPINDTYGHATGDALLVEAARRVGALRERPGMVARLGGDEFAILARDVASPGDATAIANRVGAAFDAPFVIGAQEFRVGASVGFAFAYPGTAPTVDLLNHADIALYEAKKRNAREPVLFSPAMEAAVKRRMLIEQALADAEQCHGIHLAFQPFMCAEARCIFGFEALARWTHPVLGAIPPSEFIAIAEQNGKTDTLTRRLFNDAVATAVQWPGWTSLSFNLSAAELASPQIAPIMIAIMQEQGFPPGRLLVEVTETALLNDFEGARATLAILREAGARICLDDFGAGYASIGYLREMDFNGVKLDGSLIAEIETSEAARNLLVGVLALCRAIGTPVVVEAVETEGQLALLAPLNIGAFQGYYFARPMPGPATFEALASHEFATAPDRLVARAANG